MRASSSDPEEVAFVGCLMLGVFAPELYIFRIVIRTDPLRPREVIRGRRRAAIVQPKHQVVVMIPEPALENGPLPLLLDNSFA